MPLSQFCCTQEHANGRRYCAPRKLLEHGMFEKRFSWLRHHYKKYHPRLFAEQIKRGVKARMTSKRNPVLDGPYYSKKNAEIAKDNLSYSYGGVLKIKKTAKGWFVTTPEKIDEGKIKRRYHNPKYVMVHLPGVKNPVMGILNPK